VVHDDDPAGNRQQSMGEGQQHPEAHRVGRYHVGQSLHALQVALDDARHCEGKSRREAVVPPLPRSEWQARQPSWFTSAAPGESDACATARAVDDFHLAVESCGGQSWLSIADTHRRYAPMSAISERNHEDPVTRSESWDKWIAGR